ncbi:MAG: T9SS type A sorting domain-containing protein [Bacteroidota bacterium]
MNGRYRAIAPVLATLVVQAGSGVLHAQGGDADLPRLMEGRVSKEEYILQRDQYIAMLRGLPYALPYDPRVRAINAMQAQVSRSLAKVSATAWVPIGPAPIPNGQTESIVTAVSGRVSCIAVHPTNPNIIYVGAAQGGVYRSVDGGAHWTPIFDAAQSLSVGALALAPSNPSILYVGTGEPNLSCDSYAGVGLYRIDNADTSPILVGPINPAYAGISGSTAFAGRAISKILVHPTDPATIFVSTTSGIMGLGCDSPLGGSLPPLAPRGIWRSTNATAVAGSVTFTRLTVTTANSASDGTGNRSIPDMVFFPGSADTIVCTVLGFSPGTDGGIYRSTNALAATPTFTKTFTLGTTGATIRGSLDVYRRGGITVLYLASGESASGTDCNSPSSSGALRRSTDGGVSWSGKLAGGGGFCGGQCFYDIAIAVVPGASLATDTIHLGGSTSSVSCERIHAISFDGGATFTNYDTGLHVDTHSIIVAPSNTSVVYHGNDGGVYRSSNGGLTWASLNNSGFSATQFQSIALHPTDPYFSIGGTQDNGTNLFTPGQAWNRIDYGDGGQSAIDQNATDASAVTMYHTYFNATNSLIGFARVNSTACAVEGQWSFLGIYGGFVDPTVHCDGTSDSFNGISISDPVNFYAPLSLGPGNPNTVYFGTNRLYRSTDKGTTMPAVSQSLGSAVSAIGISPQNDQYRIVGTNGGGLFYTTTGGNPLTTLDPVGGGSVIPDRYVARAVFDPNNSNTAYITLGGYMGSTGSSSSHVWKITNLNTTPVFTGINTGLPDVPVNAFVVDRANSNNLFAGTDIGVYNSTDGGASWSVFGLGLPVVAVFDMALHPVTRVLRIATHGRGFWENNGPPLPVQLASFTGTLISGSAVLLEWTTLSEVNTYGFEVQKSSAPEGLWASIPNSFILGHGTTVEPHQYSFTDNAAGSGRVYYRLKQLDLDGSVHYSDGIAVDLTTGVAESRFPTEFSLEQSYPNPFNPSTLIRYGLPRDADVVLEVYNMLGQRVQVLVKERQGAGYHQVRFDASGLSSGAYFYAIHAGEYYATKRLVLLR